MFFVRLCLAYLQTVMKLEKSILRLFCKVGVIMSIKLKENPSLFKFLSDFESMNVSRV